MNPQYFFYNDNNEHRRNFSPCGIFICPRCVAHFSAMEERDVQCHREPFSLYNQEGREIMFKDWYKPGSEPKFTYTCCEKHSNPVSNYYACASESTPVTQMLLPPYNKVKPFDFNQFPKMAPAPIGATQVDAYFQQAHEMTPIMSNDHGIISMVPQRMTMDLLSAAGQPTAPIVPGCGAKRRSYQMDVSGQEGEASAHAPLALTLALPVPDIETEATTLALGPPGLEKKSTKKAKLDLNLKM